MDFKDMKERLTKTQLNQIIQAVGDFVFEIEMIVPIGFTDSIAGFTDIQKILENFEDDKQEGGE